MIDLGAVPGSASFAYSSILHVRLEEKGRVVLYPNPVSEVIYISDIILSEIEAVTITDMKGKVALDLSTVSADGINIGNLYSGIYMISIKTKKGALSNHKVVS